MTGERPGVAVRYIQAAETRPLRHAVLRPSQPAESTVYPGDDDPSTVHLGAFLDDRVVGIASLYAERRPDGPRGTPGWRLRGMASAPRARGIGVGWALLRACIDHVASHGGGELWCNARVPAAEFYARAGFETVSEPFDIPEIGAHVVMRRLL